MLPVENVFILLCDTTRNFIVVRAKVINNYGSIFCNDYHLITPIPGTILEQCNRVKNLPFIFYVSFLSIFSLFI